MQPTYVYPTDMDREIEWRSKFSVMIPVVIGIAQMILTFAIVGLEIGSLIISPIQGTLYAGFWLSVLFVFSWVAMFTLVCCHRSRKCALYVFFVSILCAAAAITLIVLDALFIGRIDRCFFSNAICLDLASSYRRQSGIPLGRKVQVLKGQLACAAAMLATALLYMLLFILASMKGRRAKNQVLIANSQQPAHVVRPTHQAAPSSHSWKAASVPVTYEPSQIECPHCRTAIKLAQQRY